jgi:hypothetical protein
MFSHLRDQGACLKIESGVYVTLRECSFLNSDGSNGYDTRWDRRLGGLIEAYSPDGPAGVLVDKCIFNSNVGHEVAVWSDSTASIFSDAPLDTMDWTTWDAFDVKSIAEAPEGSFLKGTEQWIVQTRSVRLP